MSRRDKQYQRLQTLEAEFRNELTTHLQKIITGTDDANKKDFFFSRLHWIYSNFNRRQKMPVDDLLTLGDEILELCEQLGEPPSVSVLALHKACEERGEYHNDHRLGSVRLAQRLLDELKGSSVLKR